jgi:hypothetical protein
MDRNRTRQAKIESLSLPHSSLNLETLASLQIGVTVWLGLTQKFDW